jgi:hypothetical protein
MLPRELALVQRLEKKPFALIGIDTDKDLAAFKAQREKMGITWRNVWEGPVGAGRGPLSRAWNVHNFPTVFILDARGIIRSVDHGEGLERTVDALLEELEKSAANR